MLYFAIDSGTTNSRLWLMRDREVLARKRIPVGVRNTAIDGNNRALVTGIRQALLEMQRESNVTDRVDIAIAAGMITSNLGLHEVRHVQAPAGLIELASNIQGKRFPDFEGLSFFFIPGVRSGPDTADLVNVGSIDIVRGEETEVMGALEEIAQLQDGPLLYVHLGSHTKLIQLDVFRRISSGASTLAGELTQSILEQTILRSSLPEVPFVTFSPVFFSAGWEHCQALGFTRALYEVRVLQLNSGYPKADLASFLLGIVVSQEFRCLEKLTGESNRPQVLLSGLPHLQTAWAFALETHGFSVRTLTSEETERCFLKGLRQIFQHRTA
ncbi:MAG: hypothetical protein FJW26_06265 [Acidimicrobiia bacterium]|nr:hypothetical protein [Acidimicrobiia bacterium]